MSDSVDPIPAGCTAITPHLVVDDCAAALDFYGRAFGAVEDFRMPSPDGAKIMHAEIRIGGDLIMLADAMPEMGSRSPKALGGSPVGLQIRVADADAAFARAVDAGCDVTMPLADMFWGDRYGRLSDPYGHVWAVAQRVRDLTPDEIMAGMKAACGGE